MRIRNVIKSKPKTSINVLLEVVDKTFSYYYDMTKRVEGKANMLIVIIGILYTLIGGYVVIPLNRNIDFTLKVLCIFLFIVITVAYIIAIIAFLLVLNLQEYHILQPDTFSDKNIHLSEEVMGEFLVKQYRDMIVKIKYENKRKCVRYKIGLKGTLVGTISSFILISISFFIKGVI